MTESGNDDHSKFSSLEDRLHEITKDVQKNIPSSLENFFVDFKRKHDLEKKEFVLSDKDVEDFQNELMTYCKRFLLNRFKSSLSEDDPIVSGWVNDYFGLSPQFFKQVFNTRRLIGTDDFKQIFVDNAVNQWSQKMRQNAYGDIQFQDIDKGVAYLQKQSEAYKLPFPKPKKINDLDSLSRRFSHYANQTYQRKYVDPHS